MVQVEVRIKKILTGLSAWPVEMAYDAHWLDTSVYMWRDSVTRWLTEHNIEFIQHQFGKRISWALKSEEAATMFLLRWAD